MTISLVGYLDRVSDYWRDDMSACSRCVMLDYPGYCAMLHDRSVPDGDCLGVLERDGVKQPGGEA